MHSTKDRTRLYATMTNLQPFRHVNEIGPLKYYYYYYQLQLQIEITAAVNLCKCKCKPRATASTILAST